MTWCPSTVSWLSRTCPLDDNVEAVGRFALVKEEFTPGQFRSPGYLHRLLELGQFRPLEKRRPAKEVQQL